MNRSQRETLDIILSTPPRNCIEDGHSWYIYGYDEDGEAYTKCRYCKKESIDISEEYGSIGYGLDDIGCSSVKIEED